MRRFQASLFAAAMIPVVGAGSGANAQPMGGSEYVTIRASSDFDQMHAGERGLLAIDIIVEDGWHTYWPGVSDTGYGISFDIDAPEWVELKDPIWPSPKRYLQKGDILDHTYEGTETVLVPFIVKEDITETGVVFNIDADFLVCNEICLPGKGSATTAIQLVGADQRQGKTSEHDRIQSLYEKRPEPFNAKDLAVRLQWIKTAAAVMHRDATRIEFYPDNECTALLHPIEDPAANGNRIEIRFAETENKVLSGRLRVTTEQGELHFDIHETAP
jgi:DsbC/DsbD-like thiol-disulfide interchange protein